MENYKMKIKSARIHTLNIIMLSVAGVLFFLVLCATKRLSAQYHTLTAGTLDYIECGKAVSQVVDGSDYLTEQVRLYVQTMNPKYAENYFTELYTTRRRDLSLEKLADYCADRPYYSYLQDAVDRSDQLTQMEIYAILLVTAARDYDADVIPPQAQGVALSQEDQALGTWEKIDLARSMVFSDTYLEAKDAIQDCIDLFMDDLILETEQQQRADIGVLERLLLSQRVTLLLLFGMAVMTFTIIILFIYKPLQTFIQRIRNDQELPLSGAYELQFLACVYNDIHRTKSADTALLRYQAEHDPLTGLMNRGAYDNLQTVFQQHTQPLALLLIDIDHFKEINDRYGHQIGDKVLQRVARLLHESFRTNDLSIRFGGDEFAVVVTDITLEHAPVIEKKITAINRILQRPEDGLPRVSLSVGAAFSADGFHKDLYRQADQALYRTKANGRCGFSLYLFDTDDSAS
jgi:diguanylate cyclase (GGDEF)-like protein